jgi:hypothetical protein
MIGTRRCYNRWIRWPRKACNAVTDRPDHKQTMVARERGFSLRLRTEVLSGPTELSHGTVDRQERQRSRANPLSLSILGCKQLPAPLGDDFDGAVGHFYGGLIVNRVRRHWQPRSPFFRVGQGVLRESLVIQVRNQSKVNQSSSLSRDEGPLNLSVGCSEHDVFRREHTKAVAGRIIVALSQGGGRRHAPGADSHIDRPGPQRRQQVCESGLPHPVAQIQDVAAPEQQGVSLLDRRDPIFFSYAGQRGELQYSQGLPTQFAQGGFGFSADRLPCHTSTAGVRVYRGGNEEAVGLGNRFAQQVDQRVVDARVADTRRSEKKPHDSEEICSLTGVQKYRREPGSHKKDSVTTEKFITSYFFV